MLKHYVKSENQDVIF